MKCQNKSRLKNAWYVTSKNENHIYLCQSCEDYALKLYQKRMHFWRENIDLIDSSWLVIQIMIWINSILIESPPYPKVIYTGLWSAWGYFQWSPGRVTRCWGWYEKNLFPMLCQQDKEQIIPGRPTKHQLQTVSDLRQVPWHPSDFALVRSDTHST